MKEEKCRDLKEIMPIYKKVNRTIADGTLLTGNNDIMDRWVRYDHQNLSQEVQKDMEELTDN